MLLLKKAESGDLPVEEADRLATEALMRKEENTKLFTQAEANKVSLEGKVAELNAAVETIKSNIAKYENELKTLKARVKVSSATKNLNKQMAQLDSTDTVSMLERMKDKVAQEEALAESYGEIANMGKSVDSEINAAVGDDAKVKASSDLEALKAKMGLNKPE